MDMRNALRLNSKRMAPTDTPPVMPKSRALRAQGTFAKSFWRSMDWRSSNDWTTVVGETDLDGMPDLAAAAGLARHLDHLRRQRAFRHFGGGFRTADHEEKKQIDTCGGKRGTHAAMRALSIRGNHF
jgi:hypothetical protein